MFTGFFFNIPLPAQNSLKIQIFVSRTGAAAPKGFPGGRLANYNLSFQISHSLALANKAEKCYYL